MSASPNALMQQALQLQQMGRYPQAAELYARLLAEWPDLPTCWYNFGYVLRMCGRFEEALSAYEQALKRHIAQPEEVRLNRAVIFADQLRNDEAAERELNAALMLNPYYVPALVNLANLREDQGARAEARQLYETVLQIDPQYHLALARLAGLSAVASADDPLISRLRTTIARPSTAPADKAALGFALGRLLDACGSYDAAFEAYAAANRASRESSGGKPLYDRKRHEQFVDRIIAAFPAAQTPARGNAPIFICGMFRSGSTLCEQVLGSHPRVTAGGELDVLPALVRSALPRFPEGIDQTEKLASLYTERLAAMFPGADRITDKRPDNYLYIGLIKQMFPDARIIHTRRNALDNGLSIYFLHLDQSMGYGLDLGDIAHHYRQYRRLMDHWRTLYRDDIFDFDYDGFVHEPRPILEKLLAFCGLDWDAACLEFHRSRASVKTASVWQVREPLHTRSSERWRNYEKHIGALKHGLAGLI